MVEKPACEKNKYGVEERNCWQSPPSLIEAMIRHLPEEFDGRFLSDIQALEICPDPHGRFVSYCQQLGLKQTQSIPYGEDFLSLKTPPKNTEIILANPPFSKKIEFLTKACQWCHKYNLKFVMVLPSTILDNDTFKLTFYQDEKIQIVRGHTKINYIGPSTGAFQVDEKGKRTNVNFDTILIFGGFQMKLPKVITYNFDLDKGIKNHPVKKTGQLLRKNHSLNKLLRVLKSPYYKTVTAYHFQNVKQRELILQWVFKSIGKNH